MSLDGPGFHVDVAALDAASTGISQTTHDQETFALRGLCGDTALYGHDGVHGALANFCARWSDGLTTLTTDAGVIADTLTRAADAYRGIDEAAVHTLTTDPALGAVDH
jgi:hypothetical protein